MISLLFVFYSLGPGSALGEKGKKKGVGEKKKKKSEASRGVVWGGERVAAALSACGPQSNAGLASLADVFPI